MKRTREHVTIASIAVGYRLREAKALEGHGGWLPWLAARGINERTARRTMELAAHHEYLSESHPEKLPGFMSKSLRAALAVVQEERAAAKAGKPRPPGSKSKRDDPAEPRPEVEILPPDPVHTLHHLAQQWPADAILRHQLTSAQADLLEEDLPRLLPALIELAERHDVSTGIAEPAPDDSTTLRCNFCGKSRHEVVVLITGARGAGICDECVGMCVGIVAEKIAQEPEAASPQDAEEPAPAPDT